MPSEIILCILKQLLKRLRLASVRSVHCELHVYSTTASDFEIFMWSCDLLFFVEIVEDQIKRLGNPIF